MRKGYALIAVILLLCLIAVGFYFFRNKIGDIRPAVLPPKPLPNTSATNRTVPTGLLLSLPAGYSIGIFAQNLGGVRDLQFSPGGTLLASVTSSGKVIALPSKNNQAEKVKDVLTNLRNPHGIAFFNRKLYVAEETKVVRYNWDEQDLTASVDKILFDLPVAGEHFTRSIVFDKSGKLYISVGSTCNACIEKDLRYAAILRADNDGPTPKVFASGLRNSVFMALNPTTQEVWATDNGRDLLGDDIPPDEINIIRSGKNYGWPNCYGDKIPDKTFNPTASDVTCANTEAPIYKIQAHSAPLGLVFINSPQFPPDWQGDLLVAYHGSWNRSVPTGYKVVHMKLAGNQIAAEEDFLSGFLQGSQAIGRPVDLTFDTLGSLYISDDKRGVVYIVGKK